MFETIDLTSLVRNVGVYAVGVALAVAGALGLVEAVDLPMATSALLFVLGIGLVIAVHEYFGGIV